MTGTEHDVGAEAALAEGTMRGVEIDGRKVLLARVAGVCHAVDGTCPHAGAPLAAGVLRDGVVTCPWHKAAFRVDDGADVEPPAVDRLVCHRVEIRDGRIRVTLAEAEAPRETPATEAPCFLIVGAGAAGTAAARTLREKGFAGRVVLASRESRLPYDRTVLSKYELSGRRGGEKSPLHDADFYTRHHIERLVDEVVAVDPATRRATFVDGATLAFDAALVATGGTPKRPTMPGADLHGVFTLRAPEDASAIVAAAGDGARAVIVGSGFIAMEAAASLRERGLAVTVVAPDHAPFERQLGAEIGTAFRRLHDRHGVVFRLGTEAAGFEGDGSGHVRSVRLADGTLVPADLVVVGLGIQPASDILRGVTRRDDGGVVVDPFLRAAGGVYAAGEIAAFPLSDEAEPVRVEHWRVAQQQGRVAALNMMGRPTRFDAVPYFWTIQYLKRLDYVGHATRWDSLVIDGDLEKPKFVAFYLRDGRVAAVAGWDRDTQMAAVVGLMTERRDWALAALREALAGFAG